jgi:hypothetical protein
MKSNGLGEHENNAEERERLVTYLVDKFEPLVPISMTECT